MHIIPNDFHYIQFILQLIDYDPFLNSTVFHMNILLGHTKGISFERLIVS